MKLSLNTDTLTKTVKVAFTEVCLLAHREMIQIIGEPGAFQEFPGQDIVDFGRLRESQQPPEFSESKDGKVATFRNTADHAIFVALGYTLRNGREQPGRNWMQLAVTRMDFEKTVKTVVTLLKKI